ncbi:MAG TPA: hypothetical protein VGH31_07170 [Acidimicrobiales bacterium]
MIGKRCGRIIVGGSVLAGALFGAASGAGAAINAGGGKVINLGNNIEVTVAKGWTAGRVIAGKVALSNEASHAVLEIVTGPSTAATVTSTLQTNFTQFAAGFELTHAKITSPESGQISGKVFNEAASFAYTAIFKKQKLGGVAIEYQNTTTKVGAFAIVLAKQAYVSKIKPAAGQMLKSLVTNP